MTKRRSVILAATSLATVIVVALALTWRPIPVARAQAPVVLKIQASWPASLTIFEHLKFVAERVDKLSGGTLKIEALPAGTIVPAFEVLDATSKKVIDGFHSVSYYWVGKNKTAALFTGGPGGTFGMDFVDDRGLGAGDWDRAPGRTPWPPRPRRPGRWRRGSRTDASSCVHLQYRYRTWLEPAAGTARRAASLGKAPPSVKDRSPRAACGSDWPGIPAG